jgi:hypothetical protein
MRISPTQTGALIIGWTVIYAVGLLVLEWLTLADDIPGNHITAVIRSAWEKQAWAFVPLFFIVSYLAGHFFASAKEKEPVKLLPTVMPDISQDPLPDDPKHIFPDDTEYFEYRIMDMSKVKKV